MSFQTPITIRDAILNIEKNQYLLPAIQREFVWKSEKVEWLFDSIMQGYPISSFLFWKVETIADNYRFYKFINEYREWYKTHNEEISTNGLSSFTAILDGQQRLTSLYIGLKGSYAYKEYRKKWEDSETNIPTRHLYLNISNELSEQEDGRKYEFKFLRKKDTKEQEICVFENKEWFKVGNILKYEEDEKLDNFVEELADSFARKTIRLLKRTILEKLLINYFLEQEQNLDKALNIFIRINSGGEPLNFSDLIMSIAVANWSKKDARKEIHSLVDLIKNKGFNISKDLILKAFLFLYSRDIKFKATNFSKENAIKFEEKWEKIRDSIDSAFNLLKSFGFNDYSLTSKNAILPIVYYIYHKNIYSDFTQKVQFKDDREKIRKWLNTVLIKQVFGGAADSTLIQFRKTFSEDIGEYFIKPEIQSFPENFESVKKDLSISKEFIEELLLTQKEDKYAFSVLSLLYPNLDYKNNNFHKDHLHPTAKFEDLNQSDKEKYGWKVYNSILNLQMLDSNTNQSKQDLSLSEWFEKEVERTKCDKSILLDRYILPDTDLKLENFSIFIEERKEILTEKLYKLLSNY